MANPAFPAFHVTGPVHHYIQMPGSTDVYYLGTCEVQPRLQMTYARKQIMNDIAGTSVAAQEKDDGQIATISVLLNRFSHDTLNVLRPTGRQGRFSRGLLIYGIKTFQMWQVFENSLSPAVRAVYPNLPLGYYWPQCDWMSFEDAPGNQDQKILCQWKASNVFTPQASSHGVQAGEREWLLYSTLDSDFPVATLVPQ